MATPNKPQPTPRGYARFPKLVEPDDYLGKVQYKTDLVFDPSDPEVSEFIEGLKATADAALAQAKQEIQEKIDGAKNGAEAKKHTKALEAVELAPFIHDVEDRETGEPTGKVFLRFKTNADDRNGNRKSLRFVDAKGSTFVPQGDIPFNSLLRVNFTPNGFYMASQGKVYLTNYINAVQVIELGSSGGGGGDDLGFGVEEGGFVASNQTEEVSVGSVSDSDAQPDF